MCCVLNLGQLPKPLSVGEAKKELNAHSIDRRLSLCLSLPRLMALWRKEITQEKRFSDSMWSMCDEYWSH
jgi:hypothetical protein